MSTQELIAAALTAADELDELSKPMHSRMSPHAAALREACARAMVQPAAPDMAEVELLADAYANAFFCTKPVIEIIEARTALLDYVRGVIRESFRQGARAFFDHLMCRAANNYHGNPDLQKQCDQDNKVVEEWAADALEAVSPEDFSDWRAINDAYKKGVEAGIRQVQQPVGEVPMPDIAGELFDGKRVCDEADVRTYGDAREAAGYVAGGKDAERLDWLSRQFVTVRIPMRYGSKVCITGMPTDDDGESKPWNIRAAIDDAALRGEVKP